MIKKNHDLSDAIFNPLDYPICFAPNPLVLASSAWIEHIPFGMLLIDLLRPKVLVELGTYCGVSYCAFCQAVKQLGVDTHCFAVDTWEGDIFSSFYGPEVLINLRRYHDPLYSDFSRLLQSTFDDAIKHFSDGSIDLLHIDGLHTYEAVKHDFETWLPKLSDRGVVLFHDTNVCEMDFGIWKLWDEQKLKFPFFEFFHGHGLGILAVGSKYPPALNALLKSSDQAPTLREFFFQLGSRLGLELTKQELTAKVAESKHDLAEITSSKTWKIALLFRQARKSLLPSDSLREKMARRVYSALKIWHREGLITLVRKIKRHLTNKTYTSLSDYEMWIKNNEPNSKQLAEQRLKVNDFDYKPLISVVLPVWNTPTMMLNQTIKSVENQTYEKWELCIADGNSNPETKKVLLSWATKDSRIKIKFLTENKGIATNSNEALFLAQGEFVAFLDHDDLLAPFALFEVVSKLQTIAEIDMAYSDEDKISKSKKRFDPFFKPDFSPDYLRSTNYMPHFLVIRKSLGDQIGWFREGYDGAQDYDLILRLVENARVVMHIPKILYHWRVWALSTASKIDTKPYANKAGKKALQEHLNRIGLLAQVEDGFSPTFYRVRYHISGNPLISIVIPSQDHIADLEQCVSSILQQTTYPNYEIILVENGSKEPETFKFYKRLEQDARIRIIIWNQPFNYSHVNNWAATQVNGEILLFLNNDIQVINKDWLEQMLQFTIRPDVGAVGAKLIYPNGTLQHAGVIVGLGGVASHSHKYFPRNNPGYFRRLEHPHNISAVTGACLMIRKQVFQEVKGFDENYPLAFGDVDLCLKLMQNRYLNIWTPYAELYHHESKTRGFEDNPDKQARFNKETEYFKQKWSTILEQGDKYYNPNLTLDREDFSLDPRKNTH